MPPENRDEMLEIVSAEGDVLGLAPRSHLHADPSLLHRVVHVLVLNAAGSILLQKRSRSKETSPGKWDTSVGGHVLPGESFEHAARRELAEELGVTGLEPRFLYRWLYLGSWERELVASHLLVHEGPFVPEPLEIDEVRFWDIPEIRKMLGMGVFTSQFEEEFTRLMALAEGGC